MAKELETHFNDHNRIIPVRAGFVRELFLNDNGSGSYIDRKLPVASGTSSADGTKTEKSFHFHPDNHEVEAMPLPIELDQVVEVSEYFDPNEKFDYAQDTMPIPAYYPNPKDQERANSPDLSITKALIRTGAQVHAIPGIQLFGRVISADPAVPIATPSGVIIGRYHGSYGFPSGDRTLWVSKDDVLLMREQATNS